MRTLYKWLPVVRKSRCVACGLCGSVCPHGCLDLLDGTGALVGANACTSEGHCIVACVENAIEMKWVRIRGDRSIGRWRVIASPRTGPRLARGAAEFVGRTSD